MQYTRHIRKNIATRLMTVASAPCTESKWRLDVNFVFLVCFSSISGKPLPAKAQNAFHKASLPLEENDCVSQGWATVGNSVIAGLCHPWCSVQIVSRSNMIRAHLYYQFKVGKFLTLLYISVIYIYTSSCIAKLDWNEMLSLCKWEILQLAPTFPIVL